MEECTRARSAIEALIDGELGIAEEADLQTHLAGCPACSKELEERRAFSVSLGSSLRQGMQSARPKADEKKVLVDRMVASRRPGFQWTRLAATILFAIAVGVAGYASGFFGPKTDREVEASPLVKETAETVANRDAAQARYDELILELEKMTDELRTQLPLENANHAEQTAAMELAALEDRICDVAFVPSDFDTLVQNLGSDKALDRAAARRGLRRLKADAIPQIEIAMQKVSKNDRWFLSHLVRSLRAAQEPTNEIVQQNGDIKIEFRQFGNAKVQIVIEQNGKKTTIEANCMSDLQTKHGKVCKQYGISGYDGAIQIGENRSVVEAPFEDQLGIAFAQYDGVDYAPYRRQAYKQLVQNREKDRQEVAKLVIKLEEKCRHASEKREAAWKADPQTVQRQVQYLQSWDHAKLEETRRVAEKQLRDTEAKLSTCTDVEGRLKALQVYLEEVKSRK